MRSQIQNLKAVGEVSVTLGELFDPFRGDLMPPELGFVEGAFTDKWGRPSILNTLTISDFYQRDILAAFRFFFPKTWVDQQPFHYQRILLKMLMEKEFTFVQACRGAGKTSTIAMFLMLYALMYADMKVVIIAPTLRQSLLTFNYMLKLISDNGKDQSSPGNVAREIDGDIKRNNIESSIKFKNGSTITALPFGDGENLRGLRGSVLFLDEFYQFTEEAVNQHLTPFLGIQQGGREGKWITATTAWFQDCFAYKRLMQIASQIKAGNQKYGIFDINIHQLNQLNDELIASGRPSFLSREIIRDASRYQDDVNFMMSYYNVWPSLGASWYTGGDIEKAISDAAGGEIEFRRPKDDTSEYFGVADLASSARGDKTVMLVAKIVNGKAYWVFAKRNPDNVGWDSNRQAWEAHDLIERFGLKYFVFDAHAAIGENFRSAMRKSKLVVEKSDGTDEVKTVTPALLHNEHNIYKGRHILVPFRVKDPLVSLGLNGIKGSLISTEDELSEAQHIKMREILRDSLYVGPATSSVTMSTSEKQKTAYEGSEYEVYDIIRTSFLQLRNINTERDRTTGLAKYTSSGKLKFKSKSTVASDDGAFCLIYGTVILALHLWNRENETVNTPIGRPLTGNNQTNKPVARIPAHMVKRATYY